MQRWKELPGFRTFRDFFAGLFQDYDNIAPEPGLKRKLIDGIPEIEFIGEKREGTPGIHCDRLRDILDDWRESAVVREVRMRRGGSPNDPAVYYVRFEVASLYMSGEWGSPIALMMTVDADCQPVCYTFIYGNGRLQNGVKCRSYFKGAVADALKAFDGLEEGDSIEVSNADKYSENIGVWLTPDGYELSWYSHDYPWYFASDIVEEDAAREFLSAFCRDGLRGVQDMTTWYVMTDLDDIITLPMYYEDSMDGRASAVRAKRRKAKGR